MKIDVISMAYFQRRFKRLVRKFKTLDDELDTLIDKLETDPTLGQSLGAGLYKIRLASRSKDKGKSGGFRVVTHYIDQISDEQTVYLVTIYDKSEEATIDKDDLLTIVQTELADDELAEPDSE